MNPLLSIIVPVYNVAPYIKKCVTSIINQRCPRKDYEVIIVNDGTPDNSIDIISEDIIRYDNITLINKENGGLSSARNTGLKHAKGQYVWFVDSDDYIAEDILIKFFSIFEIQKDIEVFLLCTDIISEKSVKIVNREFKNDCLSGIDVYKQSYKYPYSAVQFYVYKRSFLERYHLTFTEGIIYEDILYTAKVLSHAKTCYYIRDVAYHYLIHDNSITSSKISRRNLVSLFLITDELGEKLNYINSHTISMILVRLLNFYMQVGDSDKKYILEQFQKRKYWKPVLKVSRHFKALIAYLIFSVLIIKLK